MSERARVSSHSPRISQRRALNMLSPVRLRNWSTAVRCSWLSEAGTVGEAVRADCSTTVASEFNSVVDKVVTFRGCDEEQAGCPTIEELLRVSSHVFRCGDSREEFEFHE